MDSTRSHRGAGFEPSTTKRIDLRIVLSAAVFAVVLGGFFLLSILSTPPSILSAERRLPTRLPPLTAETVFSGEYMDKFNSYAADIFPLRDGFRSLQSAMVFYLFMQTDKNGLYMDENGIGEFKAVDRDSVEKLSAKIQTIADTLEGLNTYYAYIPDKSVYSSKKLPGFDPEAVQRLLTGNQGLERYTFIDLAAALGTGSYYRTDLHWDQAKMGGVLEALGATMGFHTNLGSYSERYAGAFEGVYSGQLALTIGSDSMNYLDSPSLSATYLDERTMEMQPGPVYDMERLSGLDPYDFFLRGAQPLIILENDNVDVDRELYLFRDSFSSSLAPLLASGYSKVILIDLRYIDMRTLSRYIEFRPGSDALFLYSSLVLNNADMLLVY